MTSLPSLIRNADAALASLDAVLAELAKPLPGFSVIDWHDLEIIAKHVPSIKAGYAKATGGQDPAFIIAEIAKHFALSKINEAA